MSTAGLRLGLPRILFWLRTAHSFHELQDAEGNPIPGYRLADSVPIIGDSIARDVEWNSGADLSALSGSPVRICFVMTECDLYAFRFGD